MEYLTPSTYRKIINTISYIYNKSGTDPDMDLFRFKDVLNAFNEGQLNSKIWAVENLYQLVCDYHKECIVIGGWYGLFSILFRQAGFNNPIINIDLDPMCKELGSQIVNNKNIIFKTDDGLNIFDNINFHEKSKIIVCTACEHIDPEDLNLFLSKKPLDTLICLQSNNYYEVNSHINCSDSLQNFIESLPIKKIIFADEKPWKDKYTRYMVIGK